MSTEYKFSVGRISMGGSDIGVATGITVSYDGDPQEFRGGDYRQPLAIELGDMSVEITCETIKFDVYSEASGILDGAIVEITLASGANSGGLSGTLANCKLVSYEVASGQTDYVLSTCRFVQLDSNYLS